jgi:hypothetical protein
MIEKYELKWGAYYLGTCRNTNIAKWFNDEFIFINLQFGRPYIETIKYFGDVKEDNFDGFMPIREIIVGFDDIKNEKNKQDYKNYARKIYLNLGQQDINGEIWKPIPEYGGLYYASNMGRIKKHDGNKIMRQNFSRGYLILGLTDYYHNRKTVRVHRLIALTFKNVDKRKNLEVNHINGIKADNRDTNLEWIKHSENLKKTFILGNKTKKLTPVMVKEIKELLKDNTMFQKDIAIKYNVSCSTISEINKNKKWTGIT